MTYTGYYQDDEIEIKAKDARDACAKARKLLPKLGIIAMRLFPPTDPNAHHTVANDDDSFLVEMKTATIPMERTWETVNGRDAYRVPDTYMGLTISRALGRCCSGSTFLPIPGEQPTCTLEMTRFSGGKRAWICSRFS